MEPLYVDRRTESERQQSRSRERVRRCQMHQRHETREQAEARALRHFRTSCARCERPRTKFQVFPCDVCNGWHVGHKYISPYR